MRIRNAYAIFLWSLSTCKVALIVYCSILCINSFPPRSMITTEAPLPNKRLESLLHYLLGISKSLLNANHLARAHRVIRVDEPVLLLDLHARLIVDLVYHDLQMIILLLLDHVKELWGLDFNGVREHLPRGSYGIELFCHGCVVLMSLGKLNTGGHSLLGQEFFGTDLRIIGRALFLLLVLWLQSISFGDVLGVPHSFVGHVLIWLHDILDHMWMRHGHLPYQRLSRLTLLGVYRFCTKFFLISVTASDDPSSLFRVTK